MEDIGEVERLKKVHKRLKRMFAKLNKEDKKKSEKRFIKQYIKDWKPRLKYVTAQRAKRQYEVLGLGFCRTAGIYGFNLMDDIISVYVDGHYLACISLCRSRTELVLRDYIYFRWFLGNKNKEIQAYLDDWVKRMGHGDNYLSTAIKYENLVNRLVFEYFEIQRENLDDEFKEISDRKPIVGFPLGPLINYCEKKKLLGKLMLRKLKKMKDVGNYFVHSHHLKPKPADTISFGGSRFDKDPKTDTLQLIRLTTYFMNNIFGDYPYKVLRPREKLFHLNQSLLRKND